MVVQHERVGLKESLTSGITFVCLSGCGAGVEEPIPPTPVAPPDVAAEASGDTTGGLVSGTLHLRSDIVGQPDQPAKGYVVIAIEINQYVKHFAAGQQARHQQHLDARAVKERGILFAPVAPDGSFEVSVGGGPIVFGLGQVIREATDQETSLFVLAWRDSKALTHIGATVRLVYDGEAQRFL